MIVGEAVGVGSLAAFLLGFGIKTIRDAPRVADPRLMPLLVALGGLLVSLGVLLVLGLARALGT